MSDGWYETGQRAPRVSEATRAALTPRMTRQTAWPPKSNRIRIYCGCLYTGGELDEPCEKHKTYVIQEEP